MEFLGFSSFEVPQIHLLILKIMFTIKIKIFYIIANIS